MRSMKRTSLAFGLVNIPIRMYKATESHDIAFHQHHDADQGRIGYSKVCKDCGEVVEPGNIVKGVEHDGTLVIVTNDDLAGLDQELDTRMEVVQFTEGSDIDPILYEGAYYLEADGSDEGYALLRQVLSESSRVAVVRFSMRSKTRLGVLRAKDDILMIHTMLWPDEVRDSRQLKVDAKVEVKPQALKMAHMLVESMLAEFDPSEYVDSYTERLGDLIRAKAADVDFVTEPHDLDDPEEISDILAQLEASVKRHPAGKKRVAKKAAPRKAAARSKKVA